MGQALGAHPLLVIFALVAGAELYGIFGALLALPAARDGPRGRALPAPAHPARALAHERLRGRRARRHGAGAHRARTARVRVSAGAPLIACAGLIKSFGERQVLGPVDLALAAGRSPRAARPERRGQDDAALAARRLGRAQRGRPSSGPSCARSASSRSAPRSTAASARARTSSSSRGSRGVPEPEAELAELAAAVALGDALDRPVERLSLGQAQRVNVAIGLLGRPRVVLLDEPTAALDPGHRLALWAMLERVSERGGARRVRDPERRGGAPRGRPRARARRRALPPTPAPQEAFWREAGAVDEAGGHERAFVAFVERARSAA